MAEEKSAIDAAIDKSLAVLPQLIAGDIQGAMNMLHTEEKPPAEKKEAPKPVEAPKPPEKKGLFSGILGRKK